MICVTGVENDLSELVRRLERFRDHPLQEIRLDALQGGIPPASALPLPPEKIVVACRRRSDGGLFDGDESSRIERIKGALEWNPAWVDLEADAAEETTGALIEKARARGTKILRSLHRLSDAGPGSITRDLALLSGTYGHGIKLATQVDDMIRLAEMLQAPRSRTLILVGMGPAGVLSRALSRRFKSDWTYVTATPWPDPNAFVPGMGTGLARSMPVKAGSRLFALLGNASIAASPGPAVYNRLFEEKAFDAVYLPAVTEHAEAAFSLLCDLGLCGASVTIPHKRAAAELASKLGYSAAACDSVNTLYASTDGKWHGENTDIPAVQAVAQRLAVKPLKTAAVLGTGGFARACALAMKQKGMTVTMLGRTILPEDGCWDASLELNALPMVEFDILINATPIGGRAGDETIVPENLSLKGKVVIDSVLSRAPTKLVERARADGGYAAEGVEVWAEQGARQLALFNGPKVDPEELCRLAKNTRADGSWNPAPADDPRARPGGSSIGEGNTK